MDLLALEALLGFAIGLALGLLGGGGSILTVPALVYLIGQPPQAAVTTSLAIVGFNSVVGAALHRQRGTLNTRVALIFGGAGMAAAYLAAGLSHYFSPALLMVLFAVLMLVVALFLLLRRERAAPDRAGQAASSGGGQNLWLILLSGAGVGLLTGILGVGGGFLIVPALVMLVGLPIGQAVGTSLAIIAANSLAGLLGHFSEGGMDWGLLVVFGLAGIGGTFLGARLALLLPANRLRQSFAIFVLILAVLMLIDNFPKLMLLSWE